MKCRSSIHLLGERNLSLYGVIVRIEMMYQCLLLTLLQIFSVPEQSSEV